MNYSRYQTTEYGGPFIPWLVHLMPRAPEGGITFEIFKSGYNTRTEITQISYCGAIQSHKFCVLNIGLYSFCIIQTQTLTCKNILLSSGGYHGQLKSILLKHRLVWNLFYYVVVRKFLKMLQTQNDHSLHQHNFMQSITFYLNIESHFLLVQFFE